MLNTQPKLKIHILPEEERNVQSICNTQVYEIMIKKVNTKFESICKLIYIFSSYNV